MGTSNVKEDSRNSKLIHKRVIYKISKVKTKSETAVEFAEFTKQKIKEFYGDKQRKVIVCGDGDEYIKTIADYLNAEQVLDFFHLKSKIRKTLPFSRWRNNRGLNILCNQIMEVIKIDPQTAIEKYLLPLKKEATAEKAKLISESIRYINSNLNGILAYQAEWYNGCFTESNVYHFVKSISNQKSYSIKTFKNLIALRTARINTLNPMEVWKYDKELNSDNNAYTNRHIQWYFKSKKPSIIESSAVKQGSLSKNGTYRLLWALSGK